jgi:phytoene desaturase
MAPSLDLTYQMPRMREQLDALEPGAFGQFLRFMAEGYTNYNLGLDKFVGRNFYSLAEYFDLRNLPLLLKMKALVSHASNTKRYFKDSRLQAAFSFQNMYLGLSPYEAPATYSLLQYTELGDGVWFPKGGMYRPIESLAQIAAGLGVRFEYGTAVKQINVEGNRASGVTLEDGKSMRADLVVANADLPYVYSALLPEDGTAAQLQRKKYTSSALMFYWGVKGERSPELLHHNVFLADDEYRASFETIFHDLSLPQTPSFYVNAPARTDPSFAPSDGDALMVLVPVGHINEGRATGLGRPAGTGAQLRDQAVGRHRREGFTQPDRAGRNNGAAGISQRPQPGQGLGLRPEPQLHPDRLPAPAQPPPALQKPVFCRGQHPSWHGPANRTAFCQTDRRTDHERAGRGEKPEQKPGRTTYLA